MPKAPPFVVDAFRSWCARHAYTPRSAGAYLAPQEAKVRCVQGAYILSVRHCSIVEENALGLGFQYPLGTTPVSTDDLLNFLRGEWAPPPLTEEAALYIRRQASREGAVRHRKTPPP